MSSWHVAYCEPRRELFARDRLQEAGVEVFAPYETLVLQRAIPGRPGKFRTYKRDVGVWSPYVFCRTDEFKLVEDTPGVLRVVKACGAPIRVPERVIARLREFSDAKGRVVKDVSKPSFWFRGVVGDRFEFAKSSVFSGKPGKILSLDHLDDGKIMALVTMLGAEREALVCVEDVGHISSIFAERRVGSGPDRVGRCEKPLRLATG